MTSDQDTLGDALPREIARVQALIPIYARWVGPSGAFAIALMEADLANAIQAMAEQDVAKMITFYNALKGYKS